MITSARRLTTDKPEVQISFSLDESSGMLLVWGLRLTVMLFFLSTTSPSSVMAYTAYLLPKQQPREASTKPFTCRIHLPFFSVKQVHRLYFSLSLASYKENIYLDTKPIWSLLSKCFTAIQTNVWMAAAASGFLFNTSLLCDSLICFYNTGLYLKVLSTSSSIAAMNLTS